VIRRRLCAAPVSAVAAAAAVVLAGGVAVLLHGPPPALSQDATSEIGRPAEGAGPAEPRALAELRDRRSAVAARTRARRLLAQKRFHEPSFPRPLRGVFQWIGSATAPLVEAVQDAIDGIASLVPGGRPVGLALLAGAALLGFAALASRTLRLRSRRRATEAARESATTRGPSAAELERAAVAAERAGDHSLAVRLRFRAGLLALEQQGAISLRASLTTAAIASSLGSREFRAVASSFEEVAYGGRAADPADVEAQRSGWRRVLEEVRA